MQMIKLLPLQHKDPGVNHYNNIEELPKHFFDELRHFFEEYKKLENKAVKVEEFGDKTMALKVIENAIDAYKAEFWNIMIPIYFMHYNSISHLN